MSDVKHTASDQRALNLYLSGEITEDTRARVFPHTSDSGTVHTVVLFTDGTASCTCKASPDAPCYAVKAARLIVDLEHQAVLARAGQCIVLPRLTRDPDSCAGCGTWIDPTTDTARCAECAETGSAVAA